MRRFFIQSSELSGPSPAIRGQDVFHMRKVLRLQPEDHIILLDGQGNEYEASIKEIFEDHICVEIIRQCRPQAESPLRIIIMQAFLKEKKMDMLVRSLTETGMSTWIPIYSERSIPRPDEKRISLRLNRWTEIARESLKQCRRSVPPEILHPLHFDQAIYTEKDADLKIIFWENEICPLIETEAPPKKPFKIIIMLGPEGGFSPKEIEKAKSTGFISASLGPRILRAETAALTACVLIQYIYGDMGKKPLDSPNGFP